MAIWLYTLSVLRPIWSPACSAWASEEVGAWEVQPLCLPCLPNGMPFGLYSIGMECKAYSSGVMQKSNLSFNCELDQKSNFNSEFNI